MKRFPCYGKNQRIFDAIKMYFSHNDAHGGNMMRDKNGTADTITLIDFDLTGYGFPAFDWAYFLYYSRQGSSYDLQLHEGFNLELVR